MRLALLCLGTWQHERYEFEVEGFNMAMEGPQIVKAKAKDLFVCLFGAEQMVTNYCSYSLQDSLHAVLFPHTFIKFLIYIYIYTCTCTSVCTYIDIFHCRFRFCFRFLEELQVVDQI